MVTPKILSLIAGGAAVATAGTGIIPFGTGGTESTTTSKAATLAQLDCDRIAEQMQLAMNDAERGSTVQRVLPAALGGDRVARPLPDGVVPDVDAEVTTVVRLDDTDLIDPAYRQEEMTFSGRIRVQDLDVEGRVHATTITGDTWTFHTDDAGEVLMTSADQTDAAPTARIVCANIATASGLVHVTASDAYLRSMTRSRVDTTDHTDGHIPDEMAGLYSDDPRARTDVRVEVDADYDTMNDRDGQRAEVRAEAEAEAHADA